MEKMTANELADFIEISNPNDKTHQAIATMLRKQQAEIEALKNARDYWCLAYKDVFNKLETLKNDSK
jgi:hypothetical protein